MAKQTNKVGLKGILEVDFNGGVGTITEIVREEPYTYNLFEIIEQFDGKTVTISITEDKELPTVDEA